MAQCRQESSVEKTKNLLHHCLSSNNVKGFIADKTENQLANIILTDLKFKIDVFIKMDTYNKDDFYFNLLTVVKYLELAFTLKLFS